MLSHEEMVGLQAESHELIEEEKIRTKEEYVLHLIHTAAYERHLLWLRIKKFWIPDVIPDMEVIS